MTGHSFLHARRVWRPRRVGLAVALAAALSAACARPSEYKAPVARFRDASAVVIEGTKGYLIALNKTERDHYLFMKAAGREQIQLLEVEKVQVFTAEAIAVRLEALDQLADYTELLYRLATSDAPETVRGRAKDLGTAVANLSGEVGKLTGADDQRFATAATKVLPIIGEVLKAFVEKKLEDALKQAITTGAAPVNELIEAIKVDSEIAFQRKRQALSARRGQAALRYNTEFAKGEKADSAALRSLAEAVSAMEDKWEAFQTARPVDGLAAMQRANLALEKFAKTPRPSVTDFASFVDAVEVFASAAERVGEAIQQLKALDERTGQ
jgi:hypothetical protein